MRNLPKSFLGTLAAIALVAGGIAASPASDVAVAAARTNETAVISSDSATNHKALTGFFSSPHPAWLTDLSVGVRQSYDDNVFLAGADAQYLPKKYVVPPGSVAALKDLSSWVTTVSPKVAINVAPLLGGENLDVLSLSYAPEFANYYDTPSENYNAQRFGTAIKGHVGAFSLCLDNNFAAIDGNSVAPTYPGGFYSAIAIATPRERREQIQDRSAIAFRYDAEKWFLRPAASLLLYDMETELVNVTGYQNYCDRYDVNGGADFGWKLKPEMAVTLGYRYGYQYQEQFSFTPYSSPSHYQRLLFGFEGTPCKWLEVKVAGGPDFRDYAPDTLTHITPVTDKNPVKYYGEATIAAKISSYDLLTFKSKQVQWVSSLGKVPYYDSLLDLGYRRIVTSHLNAELGGKLCMADYASGNLPACRRDDWQYTISASLTYNFNAHLMVNLAYSLNLGRNAQENVALPQTREYNQNLVSCGLGLKF